MFLFDKGGLAKRERTFLWQLCSSTKQNLDEELKEQTRDYRSKRGAEEANTCLLILFPGAKFPASRLGPLPFSLDKGGCILKTAGRILYILWDNNVIGGREALFVPQWLPSE